MKKETSYKIIAVIALLLGIVGLSIGFAAFSKTLNISSATVNTTARTNVFEDAVHYDTDTGIEVLNDDVVNVTNINSGTLTTDTWSNISFTIDANSTYAEVSLKVYAVNESDYVAYINRMWSEGTITCTALTGTNQDLVDNACESMELKAINSACEGHVEYCPVVTSIEAIDINGGGRILANGSEYTILNFVYQNTGVLPDGPFTVTIPTLHISFTSTPPSGN